MRTWINILEESLNSSYPYKMIEDRHRYVATFKTDEGKTGQVIFSRRSADEGKCEIIFHVGFLETLTGSGDGFKVLSTVVAATKQFMHEHPETSVFYFSGKEPSRLKIYRALINRFANDFRVEEKGKVFFLYR